MEEEDTLTTCIQIGANVSIFVFGDLSWKKTNTPETNTLQPIFQNLRQLMKCLKSI